MSREFVDAIVDGNNIGAEEVFKTTVGAKVGDALELRRKDLANTFVKTMSVETEESDDSDV
jgi:hypothetical protein|tara:strand:+ start:372 stop:554 length:183 start_codon:yes stop_codon:yes gene_type:complete